jgi:hypothetical protein
MEEFSQLMDQVTTYGQHPNPLYYVTQFIDGLKPTVRLMVAIQMQEDLDRAFQLALMHEELGDGTIPLNAAIVPRQVYHPPAVVHQPIMPTALVLHPAATMARPTAIEDKWTSLCNYKKAKGLCFTCGERWGKEHKCKGSVQLNIVQEMVEFL